MITRDNLTQALDALGFECDPTGLTYSKRWDDTGASIVVDFQNERIEYPIDKGFRVNIATTCNFSDNENFVVFVCVTKLFDKGYRPESIELERRWSLGHEQKGGKADICIDDEQGDTLVIIECKTPGKEYRDEWRAMQDGGGQLFSYWQQERATRWLVLLTCDIHDSAIEIEQRSIRCTDDENYRELAKSDDSVRLYAGAHTVAQLHDVWLETYNGSFESDVLFGKRSTAYNPLVPPLLKGDLVDFRAEDRIVNQFEEILRHNNVSDKENAFNRLIALFIAKLQDEISKLSTQEVEFQYKQGRDTYETLQDRLQRLHSEGMKKLMREEVFYVPSDEAEGIVSRYTGQNRKRLIEALNQTFRKLKFYTNSDFAFKDVHNEQLFLQNGKILVEVVKLFQPYRIVQPGGMNPEDGQFLGDLFEQLLNHGFKQNEGQFFTPLPITRFMWKSLPLDDIVRDEGDGVRYPRVIDFACGAGHFLTEGFERITEAAVPYDPEFEDYMLDSDWVRNRLVGVEKDYRLARTSRVSLYMHGAGQGEIVYGDGLENYPDKGVDSRKDGGRFDILTANPPYSVAAFKPHLKLRNNTLELLDCITDNGAEIETLFVERAAQLVRPSGYAAIILPSTILDKGTNSSFVAARDVLLRSFELVAIARFGSGTFGATGTNVAILFLRRFDEIPSRDDSARDFVDAVFGKDNLDGWQDADDFCAYLDKIQCDRASYFEFIERTKPWQEWENSPHFSAYHSVFAKSTALRSVRKIRAYKTASQEGKQLDEDLAFYRYAHAEERERLRVFALVRGERTLVVNSPTQTSEIAAFLGYKWSNRKGNEGIQIIDEGGVLYASDPMSDEPKLCDVIRAWFAGDVPESGDLSQYFYYADTQDFIDFDSEKFDKSFRMPRTYYKPLVYASDVEVASLGDVASYVTKTVTKNNIALDSYVTTENMVKGRLGITPYDGDAPASAGTAYRRGDTLVSNIRPYLQKIWFADCDGACSKDVLVYRSKDSERVLPEFLHMLLWQSDFFDYDMSTFTGTGRPRGNKDALLKYQIPIPNIESQRAIVNEHRQLTNQISLAHAKAQELRASIATKYSAMFEGKNWPIESIGELATDISYGTSKRASSAGEYTYLRMNNITDDGRLDLTDTKRITLSENELAKCLVQKGDVLFNRTNSREKVGRTAVFNHDDQMVIAGYIIRIRLDERMRGGFLSVFMNLPATKRLLFDMAKAAVHQANINAREMAAIEVPVPPIELQDQFISTVQQIEKAEHELLEQIESRNKERDALLDRFIAG